MMLKKMLIVIPMVLCALAGRSESITIGDFTYWYSLSTKEGSVTKYNGSSESVEIPSTFHAPETYKDKDGETHTRYHAITVTDIGNSAFRDNTSMKTVSFHNKLKSIGSCAFYGCTALASVATSTSLTSLGSYAFVYCSGLEEAEIDGSDLNLDTSYGLFAECPNLKRVVLGDGVKSLPTAITSLYSSRSGLFSSCPKLQSVTVGSGVTIIPSYLFYDCGNPDDKLSVSFAAQITSVGSRAFSNGNITDVNIDFSRTTTIDGYAFDGCVGIRGELNLPAVKSIGIDAFSGCTGLTSVRTSSSLASLGPYAFVYCSGLEEAEIDGSDLNLGTSLFAECPNLKRVVLGDGVKSLPTAITSLYSSRSGLFSSCPKLQSVTVGSGVAIIPSYLFYDCGNPDDKLSVSFAAQVTSVGSRAFSNGNITDVNIDFSRTTTIDGYAFDGCVGIRGELNLPTVKSIGGSAFYDCIGIASVKSGNNLESIGLSAFYNCTNASSFSFAGTPPSVGSYAFRNVKSGAVGTYTAEHAAAWEAVIDDKGYWNGLKMKPSYYTVIYDANNGTGETFSQTVEWGDPQQAADGTFTWEGHYFMGWAFAPDGEVAYAVGDAVAEPTDDRVVRVYAKWSKLTLTAESADWSIGSITLRCEDTNTSGTVEPFYDLMYFDDKMDEWRVIDRDDLSIPSPVVETNTDGVRVRVTRIADMKFSKRNNGVGTVQYRVVDDENSMRTAKCVTRSRHGLFVVLDEYENGDRIPTAMHEASVFREAYLKYGNANGYISTMNGSNARKADVLTRLEDVAEKKVNTGDIFVLYYMGHGGDHHITCYGKPDYGKYEELYASELINRLHKLPAGVGAVVILNSCQSASMISREDVADGMGSIGWIVAAHTNQYAKLHAFTQCICHDGWFFGKADVRNEDIGTYGNDDGFVTFDELAFYGQQWSAFNNAGQIVSFYNSTLLENIVAGRVPTSDKSDRTWIWSTSYPSVFVASGGDIATAAAMTAANGCRTVGECYELGIDPEDPNDDLKIAEFKMKDGKPEITLNHTKDGSGNSFEDRVKILGKAELTDAEWQEVPPEGNPAHRFFTVDVEMP